MTSFNEKIMPCNSSRFSVETAAGASRKYRLPAKFQVEPSDDLVREFGKVLGRIGCCVRDENLIVRMWQPCVSNVKSDISTRCRRLGARRTAQPGTYSWIPAGPERMARDNTLPLRRARVGC